MLVRGLRRHGLGVRLPVLARGYRVRWYARRGSNTLIDEEQQRVQEEYEKWVRKLPPQTRESVRAATVEEQRPHTAKRVQTAVEKVEAPTTAEDVNVDPALTLDILREAESVGVTPEELANAMMEDGDLGDQEFDEGMAKAMMEQLEKEVMAMKEEAKFMEGTQMWKDYEMEVRQALDDFETAYGLDDRPLNRELVKEYIDSRTQLVDSIQKKHQARNAHIRRVWNEDNHTWELVTMNHLRASHGADEADVLLGVDATERKASAAAAAKQDGRDRDPPRIRKMNPSMAALYNTWVAKVEE